VQAPIKSARRGFDEAQEPAGGGGMFPVYRSLLSYVEVTAGLFAKLADERPSAFS